MRLPNIKHTQEDLAEDLSSKMTNLELIIGMSVSIEMFSKTGNKISISTNSTTAMNATSQTLSKSNRHT